jgi:pyruvate,water dikinase
VRTFSILQSATGVLDNLAGPLRRDLERLMGAADANALLSAVNAEDHLLASLGLVMGLWQVAHGEMGREMFLARFGHRSAHEIEFSMPRPAEDPDWLDRQLATLDPAGHVPEMLARQAEEHAAAWSRLHVQHPRKARSLGKRIARFRMAERNREAVRSEAMRVTWMVRLLAVQVGRLSGLGDDVFFLYQDEFESLLRDQFRGQEHIPARRQNYEGFRSLPPYPSIIIGAFDPLRWAGDSKRQLTVFDGRQGQQAVPPIADDPNLLTGFPGAAGVVEGIAHVLKEPEESSQFQTGRILIAHTTNIGWTPLFPRAAAIVTDIGAPLSHAAIVARELGVPAVVGCGNATQRLRTGDRVRVDGGRGTVEIIRRIGETKRYPHNQ